MPSTSPPKELHLNSENFYLQMGPATANELSDDVLFLIFLINSRMEMPPLNKESDLISDWCGEQGTLTTNRYSSQVCRQWRSVILSSPMIWANSLDIDKLNQFGDEWREEVMARTGSLPISVMGRFGISLGYKNSWEGRYASAFLMKILNNEWDRIRYLSICTEDFNVRKQLIYLLKKPAPNLEYLLCRTRIPDDQELDFLQLEDGAVLFLNMSPKLTFICCEGINFNFVPGLSNLCQLWLTGYMASFTIPEIYRMLQHVPLLKELLIDHHEALDSVDWELGDDTPTISLPQLSEIAITYPYTNFITELVRHIIPAPGCRLVVSHAAIDNLVAEDVSYLTQFYSAFVKTIADFRPVQHISLSYSEVGTFLFRAANSPRSFREFQSPSRCAHITFGFSNNYSQEAEVMHGLSIAVVKALVSQPDIGHITQLKLTLNMFAYSCTEVLEFLCKLESVSELTADFPTLRLLMDMQATSDFPLLPRTTTIIVTPTSFLRMIIGSPKDYLDPFLKGRMDRGMPVRILKMSKHDYSDDRRWDFLDEIEGLSVVWHAGHFGSEDDTEDSE